jgi:hypothetical protein
VRLGPCQRIDIGVYPSMTHRGDTTTCSGTPSASSSYPERSKKVIEDFPTDPGAPKRSSMRSISDSRNIASGSEIPSEDYCDQPYVVKTDEGTWLCLLTTSSAQEGHSSQHVISSRSTDQGKTWSQPIDIEPPGLPESSWVMPLKVPSGRVYAIYVHNTDNLREVICDPVPERDMEQGKTRRVDTLGHFMFKYSDDHGRTWSQERYEIPVRMTKIDRDNPYQGKVRFFWGVGKPITHGDRAYVGFAKVGRFGHGFMATSEGYFLCSDNILTENDPLKVRWELLPDGDVGLRAPNGPVADEHNLVALSDGSLYCTYRTIEGHNCHAYSRDGGHSWDGPQYATYTPGGRRIKHPRAANFVWKASNGKYLLWFHNNGTNWFSRGPSAGNRNVAWLCGGVEKNGYIYWSQPEIVLYADEYLHGPSYPDFIEEDERYFLTETQKTIARVHEVDTELLEGLWNQSKLKVVAEKGLVLNLKAAADKPLPSIVNMPRLPALSQEGGFAIDFWVQFDNLNAGQTLVDSRAEDGKGILVSTTDAGSVKISLNDGRREAAWDCDRNQNVLRTGAWHHLAVVVDGGPRIICFVVDGTLCDGGETRPFGWGRFGRDLGDVSGSDSLKIAPAMNGRLRLLRIYDRPLRTSETVGNYQAGV